jgi:AcrR family transcriptional regulator
MQILKEEIRDNIITAAVEEFYVYGYERASMRNIAGSAGISVSNTYNYYRNKEQLFEDIVEPVYRQVKDIFTGSLEKYSGRGLGDNTIPVFTGYITGMLLQMDARQRRLLLILAEKSAGTRFEKSREEIIALLKKHLVEAVAGQEKPDRVEKNFMYILSIIAANYIDGLLCILKDYRSQSWAEENIRTLLTYHLNGIKALMA